MKWDEMVFVISLCMIALMMLVCVQGLINILAFLDTL